MLIGLPAALAAALVYGFAAIVQARAVRRLDGHGGREGSLSVFLRGLLREPLFFAAVGLTLTGFVLHLVAIRTIPLYLAQAGIAASLGVTAMLAVVLLGERLSRGDWSAVAAIITGLVLLGVSSGDIGSDHAPGAFLIGLFVAIAAIVAGGLVVVRGKSRYAASMLGLLAGVSFAITGLAARLLPGLTPGDLIGSPAAYALPVSGFIGFGIYSLALERGDVTEATGPMIVLQTVGPAFVGLALLDDEVRSGWWPVAVAGFVLTGVGALALARFESGAEPSEDVGGEGS